MSDFEKPIPSRNPSAFATEIQDTREGAQSAALSLALAAQTADPEAPRIEGYLPTVALGEGAFGRVWRAWQLRTRKEVAVKVFTRRSGLDWIFLQREVERLTRLDKHAHIVTLLDANLDGELPFYAMDLVLPGSLARLVDPAAPVSVKTALKWMRQLCEALGYVHTKGIIHCDLKPANILVDEDDQIRVVDFGHSRVFTETIGSVGTLFFMAPEQAVLAEQLQPVQPDLRWDIYALGATIYTLLEGTAPYAGGGNVALLERSTGLQNRLDAYRTMATEGAGSLAPPRGVGGEFWSILRKCLDLDPNRRYATVRDVEADLKALEEKRPVSSLADHAGYRVRKFVLRNPIPVTLAVALFIASIAFGLIVASLLQKEAAQRRVAEQQRDQAETVTKFLSDMIASADPEEALGQDVTVREVLDLAAEKAKTGFAEQPLVEAALRETIGKTYRSLGLPDPAEAHLRRALELRQRNLPPGHPDIASTRLGISVLLRDRGQYADAESLGQQALREFRDRFGNSHEKVADALVALANLRQDQGDFAEAETLLQQALEIVRRLRGAEDPEVAKVLGELVFVLVNRNDFGQAESVARSALSIRSRTLGSRHPQVAESLHALGTVLQHRGRFTEAEPIYLSALEIRRLIYPSGHPLIAQTLSNFACVLRDRGELDAAEPLLREAIAINRKVRGSDSPDVATGLFGLGVLLCDKGENEEAEPLLRESLSTYRKVYGESSPNVAPPMVYLGMVCNYRKDFAAAEPLLRSAAKLLRQDANENDPQVALADAHLGDLLIEKGELEEGERLLRRAIPVLKASLFSGKAWRIAAFENVLGVSLMKQEKFAEAEGFLRSSLDVLHASLGLHHRRTGEAAERLIQLYEYLGRAADAVAVSDRYLSSNEATPEEPEEPEGTEETTEPE